MRNRKKAEQFRLIIVKQLSNVRHLRSDPSSHHLLKPKLQLLHLLLFTDYLLWRMRTVKLCHTVCNRPKTLDAAQIILAFSISFILALSQLNCHFWTLSTELFRKSVNCLLQVAVRFQSRLIISHMSSSRAELCNTGVMIYCAAALLAISNILNVSGELLLLRLLAVLSFIAHVHYFYCVVSFLIEFTWECRVH